MPKIKFVATPGFPVYHDDPDFHDGDIREISDEQYKYLRKTFPENFIAIEEKSYNAIANKMIDSRKNK